MASTELESLTPTSGTGEESTQPRRAPVISATWELFAVLAVLAVLAVTLILVFMPYGNAGFAEGYDTLIHFFKVDETLQMFAADHTYVDWSNQWYNGYPRFLFYPPFFYALAAAAGFILQSLEQISRVMVVAGVLTATLFSFLLIYAVLPPPRRFWHRAAASGAGAIVYAFSPVLLSFIIVRGKYPDYWALALVPLALFFLVRWLQTARSRIPVAFAAILALIFITHIDSAVVTAIAATVFSIVYLRLSLGNRGRLFNLSFNRPLFRLLFAFFAFTMLTAFFWLPYLGNIGSIGALQQLFPSRQPLPLNVYWQRGTLVSGISRYPGMVALFLVLAAQIFKRTRIMARSWLAVAVTGTALSLTTYTPIVRELPAVNTLFYRSGMAIAMTAIAALVGISAFAVLEWDATKFISRFISSRRRQLMATILPGLIVLLLTLGIAWDSSFIFTTQEFNTSSREAMLGNMSGAAKFLKEAKRSHNGRVLIIAESLPKFTFLPSVINKPIVNGYEGQASRTSVEIDNLLTKDLKKKSRQTVIFDQLNKWNVQYVLIDSWSREDEMKNLNESGRFETVYKGSRYHVLSYKPAGYVQPVQPVLVIGAGAGYPRNVLADMENTDFVFGDSNFVEDYSSAELSRYKAVLLYDFECYDIVVGRKRLRDYANGGGRLLISTDSSLSSLLFDDTFLGAKIKSRTFRARPTSVTGRIGGEPVSVAIFKNNRHRWYSDYFGGKIEPILVLNGKYPIIAKSRIGKGEAVFVGYNFFYHSMLEKDRAETALLRQLAADVFPRNAAPLKYKLISEGSGTQSIRIKNDKPTWAMVSMSWSPYWQALEDGKPLDVRPYGNQLAVYLPPGDHQVSLVYRNTGIHTLSTYVSIAAWLLVLATPLIRRRLRALRQPSDVEDESYLADRAALQHY